MFSIPFLITHFYPEKSEEEQQALALKCIENAEELYEKEWMNTTKEDLSKEEVQLNILKTFYRNQFGSWGIVTSIMSSLEKWTEGNLLFTDWPEEIRDFYQRCYGFFGLTYFESLGRTTQMYLLGSRFIVLASIWNIPIYVNVQNNFRRMANRDLMMTDAELFVLAIEKNDTLLGDEQHTQKTIREWVELFDKFFGNTYSGKVDEFLETSMEVSRLDEDEKTILSKILTLHWGLKIGDIYREIEGDPPMGYEESTEKEGKSTEEYYLELLDKEEDIKPWLENYAEVAYWLDITEKSGEFLGKLFFVLKKKIDVADSVQVDLMIRLVGELKKRGVDLADEIFYFDQESGTFKWDEDFLIQLPEEKKTTPTKE